MNEIGRKVELTINDQSAFVGNEIHEDANIFIKKDNKSGYIRIEANKSGFISLAKIFMAFAENEFDETFHLHLDAKKDNLYGHLNNESDNIVICKKED